MRNVHERLGRTATGRVGSGGRDGPSDLIIAPFTSGDFRLTFQVMPGGSRIESSDAPQRRAGGLQVNFDIDNLFDARREARLGDGTPAPGYGRDVQDPFGRSVRLTLQRRF